MTDLTKDKIKVILITIMIAIADIVCLGGTGYLWTIGLDFSIKLVASVIFLVFAGFWTWTGWMLWSSSNPWKIYK